MRWYSRHRLTGLPIAAALGLTGGNSSDSLEILKNVDKTS